MDQNITNSNEETYKEIRKCRVCGCPQLTDVIFLDPQFLSPTFVESNEDNALAKIKVPLTLTLCDKNKDSNACGLLQLKETTNPDLLYSNYFYRSSANSTMRRDLHDVVEDVMNHVELSDNDIVVDIGSNDGTMISYYPDNLTRIGVEPAKNINWDHLDPSIKVVNAFFTKDALQPALNGKKVKAFTCCAMFYDLDDPNTFVADVKELLHPEGVWCIQLSYLVLMLENMNFYDICHEHLEYYSINTLNALMKRHGLKIFNASTNAVNGGSARVYITHATSNIETGDNVKKLLEKEQSMNLFDAETYKDFYKEIQKLKGSVSKYLEKKLDNRERIIGLGASTKGNILLQLFGIDKSVMPYISDINPDKIGLKTLGSDMELITDEQANEMNPSCKLVLPWYFKEEIVKREKPYLDEGGELLFPMPYAHIITKEGETKL